MRAQDLYHVGIVCEDLDEAMQRYRDVGGCRWLRPLSYTMPIWTPEGTTDVPMRMVYSIDAPRIELVQHAPGTVWSPSPGNAIHHIGYAVDDVSASSAELAAAGHRLEARAAGDQPTFAYHQVDGVRVELVTSSVLASLEAMLAEVAAS